MKNLKFHILRNNQILLTRTFLSPKLNYENDQSQHQQVKADFKSDAQVTQVQNFWLLR